MKRHTIPVLLSIGLLFACGCGGKPRFPVSGQVLLDGNPLTTGTIVVAPEDDVAAFGKIDFEGRFTLSNEKAGPGCPKGTHRVAVTAADRSNPNQIRMLVPPKYADLHTSGLLVEIDGPTDDLKIELSSDGYGAESVILVEQGDAIP